MRLQALAHVSVVLLSAALLPDAFTSGDWKGQPNFNTDGEFKDCTVSAPAEAGTRFALIKRVESRLGLLINDDKLSLRPGSRIAVLLLIDDQAPLPVLGRVLERDGFVIPLAVEDPIIQTIFKGKNLHVSMVGGEFDFALAGAADALEALRNCFKTNHDASRFDL
ncbi:MAG: hypothetical protein AAF405_02800 [Pseudomonadota bacterium]